MNLLITLVTDNMCQQLSELIGFFSLPKRDLIIFHSINIITFVVYLLTNSLKCFFQHLFNSFQYTITYTHGYILIIGQSNEQKWKN